MSTVDEILATGQYTDRRGRGWDYVETIASWCSPEIDGEGVSWGCRYFDAAQMRLLIERDQHRDECRGMVSCPDHPVSRVLASEGWEFRDGGQFFAIPPHGYCRVGEFHRTLSEAMDAARALAVGE